MSDFKDKRELMHAFINCKADIKGALIDSVNPYYNSKYTSLESVLNAISDPVDKWDLFIYHLHGYEIDKPILRTTLLHKPTTQSIVSITPLMIPRNDMQALGGAITFAKRYALVSLFSIPSKDDMDDDGNESCSITAPQKIELDMLLNGNAELKARVLKGLKIKDLGHIKYADFESIKKLILKRIAEQKGGQS